MYKLSSHITIGGKRFTSVNSVTIKRSVTELAATAKITVPVSAVLRASGKASTRIETAKAIKIGDKVAIKLGYDDNLRLEFSGFVKAINLKTPLEIECEDYFYECRHRSITSSGTASLTSILQKCNLQIGHAEQLTITNFVVKDKTIAWVLSKLKTDYGLSVYFDMQGKIYAVRPSRVVGSRVKYLLRGNVINDDNLQYRTKDDVSLRVKAVCYKRDGTRVDATIGDGNTTKTIYFYDIESMAELKTLAEAELSRHSYDGYDGCITTFLLPYVEPTMVADLTDKVYPDRSGNYCVDSVTTSYGTGGARRTVEIGVKL